MVLAWHTNIASRWLDPQQHDGTASPDNFLFALHDALIKNFREQQYDHLGAGRQVRLRRGRQERDLPAARRASSFTTARRSRPRTSNGATRTIAAPRPTCSTRRPQAIEIVDDRTDPVLSSRSRFSISRSCSAPAMSAAPAGSCRRNTTRRSARTGFCRSRSAPAPTSSSRRSRAARSSSRPSRTITARCTSRTSRWSACPRRRPGWRCSSAARPTSSIWSPGELIDRVKNNPKLMLAPVVSGSWWLEFPGFQDPKNPFHDKRVREAVSLAIDRKAINDAESGGMGTGQRQLDQRRCRIRARLAEMGDQRRQGQGADEAGRLPRTGSRSTG